MMNLRDIIQRELDRAGHSRYWLARRAEKAELANRETIFRFLRGDRDTSSTVAGALLELLGMEIRPKARTRKRHTP